MTTSRRSQQKSSRRGSQMPWFTPSASAVVGDRNQDLTLTEGMANHYLRTGMGNLSEQVAAKTIHTSSQRGIRVNRLAMLVDVGERMTPGISGRGLENCLPLLVRTSRAGACLRMLLDTSLLGSTVCSLIWKVKVTPASRPLFRLQALARCTEETEYGLLPTMWATPIARDSHVSGSPETPSIIRNRDRGMLAEQAIAAQALKRQKLNPDFVERLMGYPSGWTILSNTSGEAGNTKYHSPPTNHQATE